MNRLNLMVVVVKVPTPIPGVLDLRMLREEQRERDYGIIYIIMYIPEIHSKDKYLLCSLLGFKGKCIR